MSGHTLTLQDKLALIYTLAGSQTAVADFIGISRQKVGRILRPFELGGLKPDGPGLRNPQLIATINAAFSIYKDIARDVARDHGLPFVPSVPIYMERLPLTFTHNGQRYLRIDARTGKPILGQRVAAMQTHWIGDATRRAWIVAVQQTGFFNNLSIRSTVDLIAYFDAGEERLEGKRGGESDTRWTHRENLLRKIELGQTVGHIYTKYQNLDPRLPAHSIAAEIERVLRQRHQHCSLLYADEYLLQVDTRRNDKQTKRSTKKVFGRRTGGSAKRKPRR